MLISAKTTRRTLIFLSPKEAQLLFRQLQKLSARNISALKCESRKNQMLGTMEPPLMQLSVNNNWLDCHYRAHPLHSENEFDEELF